MKFSHSKILGGVAAAAILALTLAGCSGGRGGSGGDASVDADGSLIGVSMPNQTSERWIDDGDNVKAKLGDLGYQVDLQYADGQVDEQIAQVETMLNRGAKILIIAAVDGTALSQVLQTAADDGVRVIAYDILLNETPNVDYYVTFDNVKVGEQQATSLLTGLGILDDQGQPTGDTTSKTIEIFAGSPDDSNSGYFYEGAMSVLDPYIESGQLVVGSGQKEFSQVAIQGWSLDGAQARMENLLGIAYGSGQKLDGVLSPFDGLSRGILNALKGNGYGTADLPIITGQDAEKPSDALILKSEQYSTIFKDTRKLGDTAAEFADTLLKGGTPTTNDDSYNNGIKVVPAYLHEPVIVTKENLMEVVVDSGYYTKEEVEAGK